MTVHGTERVVEQTLSRLRRLDIHPRSTPAPALAAPVPARTLADLYRDHRMRMVRMALLLVDDQGTAEDVVQEAFTGLHRHWSGLRDEAAAIEALGTLPPRQREVLVLRYYGGMSESEIADATGISRGTVKSTASRALDAVGKAMEQRAGKG